MPGGQTRIRQPPLQTTTTGEVVFLAPLDQVSARRRAKNLFGFDFVWEVYKPEGKRKFGCYTLPILWGDRLVARFDSKLDRDGTPLSSQACGWKTRLPGMMRSLPKRWPPAGALGQVFGAKAMDAQAIREPLLRERAASLIP